MSGSPSPPNGPGIVSASPVSPQHSRSQSRSVSDTPQLTQAPAECTKSVLIDVTRFTCANYPDKRPFKPCSHELLLTNTCDSKAVALHTKLGSTGQFESSKWMDNWATVDLLVVLYPANANPQDESSWWVVPSRLVAHRGHLNLPVQFGVSLFTSIDTDLLRPVEITTALHQEKCDQANKAQEYTPARVAKWQKDVEKLRRLHPPTAHYHSLQVEQLTGPSATAFETLQIEQHDRAAGTAAAPLSTFPRDFDHVHIYPDPTSLLVRQYETGAMFAVFEDVMGGRPSDVNRNFHRNLDVLHITRLDHVKARLEEQLSQNNLLLVAEGETNDSMHLPPPSFSTAVSALSPSRVGDSDQDSPDSARPRLPRPGRYHLRGFLGEDNASRRRTLQLALRWYVHQQRRPVESNLWHTAAMLFDQLPLMGLENPANYTLLERLALVQACSGYAENFCAGGVATVETAVGDSVAESESDSDCDSVQVDVDDLPSGTDDDEAPLQDAEVNEKRRLRGFWLQQVARDLYPLRSEMLQSRIVAEWDPISSRWTQLLCLTPSDLAQALLRECADQSTAAAAPCAAAHS